MSPIEIRQLATELHKLLADREAANRLINDCFESARAYLDSGDGWLNGRTYEHRLNFPSGREYRVRIERIQ